MTAATERPGPAPGAARRAARSPLTPARLLRMELRRNAMPWILPLIAALFWFDSYRPSTGPAAVSGRCARSGTWARGTPSSTSGRSWPAWPPGWGRGTAGAALADLVTAAARPRWAAQLATWAATAIWAVAAYLVFVGVMFAVYAHQGVRGTPPWWWVAVGAAAVTAFSAAGFAVGRLLPQPVRRAGGRVRRVPGHADVVADRVQPHQRVGADPADQLQRQLPGRLRDLLPATCPTCRSPG